MIGWSTFDGNFQYLQKVQTSHANFRNPLGMELF